MSVLKVDTINEKTTNSGVTISDLVPNQYQIVQVITTKPTNTTIFNSGSYTDATGFSVAITPKYSNSLILIECWAKAQHSNSLGSGNSAQDHRLLRGSTQIYSARWQNYFNTNWATSDFYPPFTMQYLDSPSTTSATTYKIQGRLYNGSQLQWMINEGNGGDQAAVFRATEIKQ
jgi:hypothetical protein